MDYNSKLTGDNIYMKVNDVILYSKLTIFQKTKVRKLFFIFLTSFFLSDCTDPITELKENIFSAQDNALVENECNSTIEAMTDWVGKTKFYKKGDRIIPGNASINFTDSSFLDLDGIEGTIDFGIKGSSEPYGLLCSDGKYRAGRINFYLNKPPELPGSIFELIIEKNDSFYTGSGNKMNLISGKLTLENADGLSLIIKADKLILIDNEAKSIEWSCNRTIRIIKDAGKGIWGDIYSMEGTATGKSRNGEIFEVIIQEPLIKKMETDCSKTFVKGMLTIKNSVSDKNILVNYDPNNDGACDNLIEADINGRKTIFRLD